jgi:hypothetical protein
MIPLMPYAIPETEQEKPASRGLAVRRGVGNNWSAASGGTSSERVLVVNGVMG